MNSRASKNITYGMMGEKGKMSNPMHNEMHTKPMTPMQSAKKVFGGGAVSIAKDVVKGVKKVGKFFYNNNQQIKAAMKYGARP